MTKFLAVLLYFCKVYPFISDIIVGFKKGVQSEKERIEQKRIVQAKINAERRFVENERANFVCDKNSTEE